MQPVTLRLRCDDLSSKRGREAKGLCPALRGGPLVAERVSRSSQHIWGIGMALAERIIFQPYVDGRRGALKPGVAVACRSPEDAQRRAEKAMASGSIVGGHIVRVMADEEAGDYGEPEFLAIYGKAPESE